MTVTTLESVLLGVNWEDNIKSSLGAGTTLADIDGAAHRIAVWSMQIEKADDTNPALSFVREMQHSVHHSGALIGLCLYKPSAAASRTFVESCIYYTYFRAHPEELATLVRDAKYYVGKTEIVDYHKLHTPDFKARQEVLGLVGRLETWYAQTSAVVHGQLPGTWNTHTELAKTSYSKGVHDLAVATLLEGASIVNDLLLCTVASRLWKSFSPDAKVFLTKGMPASRRQALGLDTK